MFFDLHEEENIFFVSHSINDLETEIISEYGWVTESQK